MSVGDIIIEPVVRQVRQIPCGVEIDLSLPVDLYYFRGHFPRHPVLPGVVQIDWAVQFADRYLQSDIGSARNFRVKFKSVIEPTDAITMILQRSSDKRTLQFCFRNDSNEFSLGSISLPDGL